MTTFALVHGAWHGAWCWDRLIPELENRGHSVIAMDLPSDDPAATLMTTRTWLPASWKHTEETMS